MKGRTILDLPQEQEWIRDHAHLPRRDAHALFCAFWERKDVSLENFKALCTRRGWKTGRTGCFQPGLVPHNKGKAMPPEVRAKCLPTAFKIGERNGKAAQHWQPIGAERVVDGYRERKVRDDGPPQHRWQAIHRLEWEVINGPVPDGHALKCLDGDRLNTDPSNWTAVPRGMLPRLAGARVGVAYDDAPDALKPTIMAVARLEHAIREART